MELVDPRVGRELPGSASARHLFLSSLDGKVIGLVDNTKPNFTELLDGIASHLSAHFPTITFVRSRKPYFGVPIPPADRDLFLSRCDAVIVGMGD